MKTVSDKTKLLRQKNEKMHDIPVDPDDPNVVMRVWVRDISFFDMQQAAQAMLDFESDGSFNINLAAYWRHAFTHWIVRSEPEMTSSELLDLRGDIGQRISSLLPSPNALAEAIQGDFTQGDSQ